MINKVVECDNLIWFLMIEKLYVNQYNNGM